MELYLPLLFVLLLLSAFFSSSETAFLTLERVRLEHMVREGRPGALRVSRLLERPRRLLSAILLGNNLANTGAAAIGTVIAAELVSGGQAALLATLAITALLVVSAPPLVVWSRIMRPPVAALDAFSRAMLALVGGRGDGARSLSIGELRTAIALGTESGTLHEEASEMMLGALALRQQAARTIMVNRVNMVMAEASESVQAAAERMAEHGYLRLPVYDSNPDDVVGYVHVSDVNAAHIAEREAVPVREVMRTAVFESELASIARVLESMREEASYLVILLDEYGALAGLVTLEDVMEVVIGKIRSETGADPITDDRHVGQWLIVDGIRLLSDLGEEVGNDLSHAEAETVGGLVLAYLRHFPRAGESIEHAGYRFTVTGAEERRVTRVALEPLEPERADGDGVDTGRER